MTHLLFWPKVALRLPADLVLLLWTSVSARPVTTWQDRPQGHTRQCVWVHPGGRQSLDTSPQGGWAVSWPPQVSAGRWLTAWVVLGVTFAIAYPCCGARVTEGLSACSLCPTGRASMMGTAGGIPLVGQHRKPPRLPNPPQENSSRCKKKNGCSCTPQLVFPANTPLELVIEKYNFVSNER